MAKRLPNTDYNVRIIRTPTGQLRLGFVQFLGGAEIAKSGPFKDSPFREWKPAPEKFRQEIAKKLGAKLLPLK